MKKGILVIILMCLLSLAIGLGSKKIKANWDDSFITGDNYYFNYYYEFELTTNNADYYQLTYLLNEFIINSTPPNETSNNGNGWNTYKKLNLGCYFFVDEYYDAEAVEYMPMLKDNILVYTTGTYPNIYYDLDFGGSTNQDRTFLSVNSQGISDYQFYGNIYLNKYLLTTPLFNALYKTGFLTATLPQYYIDITDTSDYRFNTIDTIPSSNLRNYIIGLQQENTNLRQLNAELIGQVETIPDTFFTNIFSSFKEILNTPVIPPFTIGTFILIPLMFALLGVIIHLLRG